MTSQSQSAAGGQEVADGAAVVARAFDELVRAAHQWSLYGPEHPVAKAACEGAAAALVAMLCGRASFTLTVTEDGLLAEGELLAPDHPLFARQLHQALRARQIAALTLRPGLTREELSALIRVLGTDSAELADEGGAARALVAAGAEHVQLVEVDYGRFVPASRAQWLAAFTSERIGIHATVEELVGACVELAGDRLHIAEAGGATERGLPMPFPVPVAAGAEQGEGISLQQEIAALQEVAPEDYVAVGLAWLIQASGEAMLEAPPAARKQWRDAVSQHLARLDLSLQARILRAPRQAGASTGPDMLAALVADRSPQEIADLIVARPAAVVGEPSASLERILRRALPDERKLLAVEPHLRQRLTARGMSQDSYRNVVGLLLDQIAADMAMRVGGAGEWVTAFDAFPTPSAEVVEDWQDLLRTTGADAVTGSRARVLLAILPCRHDAPQYLNLVGHLEAAAAAGAAAGDHAGTVDVVRALAREVDKGEPMRASIAATALQRMAGELTARALREALSRAAPEERPLLLGIAAKMGSECTDLLLEEVEKARDPDQRALAVRLLADAGERGASQVRHLLAQGPLDKVATAVAALIEGRDDRYLNHLAACLGHRQPVVRMRLAEWLRRAPGLVSEQILIRALYDEDLGVQATAAESLGETRARGAVRALSQVARSGALHGRRFDVRKAAVHALGRIGAAEAVPALKEILGKRSLLFRDHAQELGALAISALRRIPGPEAQQALAGADAGEPGAPVASEAPWRAGASSRLQSGEPPHSITSGRSS